MATRLRVGSWIVLLGLIAAAVAVAYEHPLSSHSIREAYFLGRRNDDKLTAFLAQYVKRLPVPKSGPHVAQIEIRTPYEQLVLRAHQVSVGYSAQQAERDYRANSDVIIVRVHISLTPTYFQARSLDFWRDFSIRFIQEKELNPKKVSGRPLFGGKGSPGLIGADVELEFDVAQVTSDAVRVEVLTPDGQRVGAEFDLGKLPWLPLTTACRNSFFAAQPDGPDQWIIKFSFDPQCLVASLLGRFINPQQGFGTPP